MKTQRLAPLALAALLLAGCGTAPTTAEFSLHQKLKAPVAVAASTVVDPAFKGTGAIAMAFQFPEREGYSVQAVSADIEKLVVTVKTRSFLLEKVVATTTVTRSQVKNGLANVKFDQLKAGSYTVSIQALDAAGQAIGDATGTAAVTEGKVIPLAINLQLDGGTGMPTEAGGGLAVTIRIIDGSAPKPTPMPPTGGGSFRTDANVLRTGNFSGCLFGATTPSNNDSAEVTEKKIGRTLDINHSYYVWDSAVPSAEDKADLAAGRIPFISFNSHYKNGAGVKWAAIASGQEDAKLHEVARGLKSLGKPVFFCFNHEPENDEARGTPAEYRAAWKRVSDVLAADGATNVVKVYVCMGWKPDLSDSYYPGDAVDWIGGDPYNWAFSDRQPTAAWREPDQVVNGFYTWAKTKHKPLMLAETGCMEDPKNPQHKAEWLTKLGATLKARPEFKGFMYFNNAGMIGGVMNGWYIDTAPSLAAFRALAQDPYFLKH